MNSLYIKAVSAAACVLAPACSANLIFDGVFNEPEWVLIDDNSGGPAPGFGAGHEVNALYVAPGTSDFFLGLAGDVQDGNRIVVFLDTRAGGYADLNYGRDNAPQGVNNLNSASTFDPGFNADFALVIGTNAGHDNFFFDLFTLSGSAGSGGGPNSFLGDAATGGFAAAPQPGSTTQGFELTLNKAALGYVGGDIQAFALYTSDGGFLSNQFISPAGGADGNYTGGPVTFGGAAPDPVSISAAALIPEPGTSALFLLGGLGLAAWRRRG